MEAATSMSIQIDSQTQSYSGTRAQKPLKAGLEKKKKAGKQTERRAEKSPGDS